MKGFRAIGLVGLRVVEGSGLFCCVFKAHRSFSSILTSAPLLLSARCNPRGLRFRVRASRTPYTLLGPMYLYGEYVQRQGIILLFGYMDP